MHITSLVRVSAFATTLALIGLAASPALAAEPVAKASATGLTIVVASTPTSTGSYAVTNDGTTESSTGTNKAALGVVSGFPAIAFGTIAQDAKTTIKNGEGNSAACAGAAGSGASLASVGNGSSCLSGGSNVNIAAGTLDLSNVSVVSAPGLGALPLAVSQLPVISQLATALNTATTQLFNQLGNPAVVLSLGAVQSTCISNASSASGAANIANAGAYIDLPALPGQPAQRINLLNFPANPAPNTQVVTDLDKVVNVLIDALKTSLNTTASGQLAGLQAVLGPLNVTIQQVQDALVTGVVGQVANQLQPINDNILNGILNKQVMPTSNSIEVTALELNVLPAAKQFGTTALSIAIGKSTCGPNARVAAAPTTSPKPTPKPPTNKPTPKVPTSVPAGYADGPSRNAPMGPWALAGLGILMAASVGAGTVAYRRSARP